MLTGALCILQIVITSGWLWLLKREASYARAFGRFEGMNEVTKEFEKRGEPYPYWLVEKMKAVNAETAAMTTWKLIFGSKGNNQ